MKKNLVYCDICNREKGQIGKHWTSSIEENFTLSFKRVPNIQSEITGDFCSACLGKIYDRLKEYIHDLTKDAGGNTK